MSRASWKIPMVSFCFLKHNIVDEQVWDDIVRDSINLKRSSVIPHTIIDKEMYIYNGLCFKNFQIRKNFIGHKFGEFSITKVLSREILERKSQKVKKPKRKK
jgi:ribosomal protein S19